MQEAERCSTHLCVVKQPLFFGTKDAKSPQDDGPGFSIREPKSAKKSLENCALKRHLHALWSSKLNMSRHVFLEETEMRSLQSRHETYQLLRQSLSTCNAFEAFAEENSGLKRSLPIEMEIPVNSACLQLLHIASKIAREDGENMRRMFYFAVNGEIKPFTHRLQSAFSRATKFGFLTELPILPFFPIQRWNSFEENLSDKTPEFDGVLTAKYHFAAYFWTFAARAAAVDQLSCSTITGMPLKAIDALQTASYVNLFNFVRKTPQMFCFYSSEKMLLNTLDSTCGDMVTRGVGRASHPNYLNA